MLAAQLAHAEDNFVDTFPDRDPAWNEPEPKPTERGNPGAYPLYAQLFGLEGFTTIGFVIERDGSQSGHTLLRSQPAGIFEASCLDYLATFKYAPQSQGTRVKERRWSYTCRYKLGP
jgi:outer membrane biosynthesis protein TonB